MKLFRVKLITKGFLHFYSTEYLKTTTVFSVLHNWALMFAINDIKSDPNKKHLENLKGANFYATPALPLVVDKRSHIKNPVPEDTGAGKMGIMLVEYFLPNSEFEFYLLSRDESEPPDMISYGKKRTKCKLSIESIGDFRTIRSESLKLRPIHPVNPLDYESIENISFAKKIPMLPSPLYYCEGKFRNVIVVPRLKAVIPDLEA